MITLLTSELNRINQEMEEYTYLTEDGDKILTLTGQPLQKEKETLKKVSLMWVDAMSKGISYGELEEIKSLMEKA
jgi:hypothetical protein